MKAKIASLEAEIDIIVTPNKEELEVANNKIKSLEKSIAELTLNNAKESAPKMLEELASLTMNNTMLLEKVSRYDKELENCYRQIKELQEQTHTEIPVKVEELQVSITINCAVILLNNT